MLDLFNDKEKTQNVVRSGSFQEYEHLDLKRLSNKLFARVDETSHVINLHLGQNLSDAVSNINSSLIYLVVQIF